MKIIVNQLYYYYNLNVAVVHCLDLPKWCILIIFRAQNRITIIYLHITLDKLSAEKKKFSIKLVEYLKGIIYTLYTAYLRQLRKCFYWQQEKCLKLNREWLSSDMIWYSGRLYRSEVEVLILLIEFYEWVL